jgi:acyl phosphate:glycerol-3-phosphate acyltransferase
MLLKALAVVLLGYLLGSFPSAYLAARVRGQDIRELGGGNMGTLNTLREVGFLPGLLVFIADVAKGVLAVLAARWLGAGEIIVFLAGAAAVAGHNWPVFTRFRGGRGGATAYGVLAGLAPLAGLIVFAVMVLALILTSNARLALTAGFLLMPLLMWVTGTDPATIIFSVVLPLLIGVRMAAADRTRLTDPAVRANLLVDHGYTFWQSRRKPRP